MAQSDQKLMCLASKKLDLCRRCMSGAQLPAHQGQALGRFRPHGRDLVAFFPCFLILCSFHRVYSSYKDGTRRGFHLGLVGEEKGNLRRIDWSTLDSLIIRCPRPQSGAPLKYKAKRLFYRLKLNLIVGPALVIAKCKGAAASFRIREGFRWWTLE